jgi:hypothetical protein
MDFAGLPCSYVEIVGPEDSILGVIAISDHTAWFAKLQGSVDLVLRERERFKSFVGSIQFKE